MAQPTTATQAVQLGVQANPDVAVVADKRLLSFALMINPEQEYDTFTPSGAKYASVVSITKDWTGGSIDGRVTYDEMTFLLASVLTQPVWASGGAGVSNWTFSPSTNSPDNPLILTVERGSSIVAERAKGIQVSEFTMTIDRNAGCSISGALLGQRLDVVGMMTPSPTVLTPGPFVVQPNQVDIFIDKTAATLGTTNLCNCDVAELKIASRYGPWWVLCTNETSWADAVETQPDVSMTLTMVANAVGLGFLDTARRGDTVFIRIQAKGSIIGASAVQYTLQFDFCGKINAVPSMGDQDGVVTAGWQFVAVHDPTWGRAMQALLVNGLPTTSLNPSTTLPAAPTLTTVAPATGLAAGGTAISLTGTGMTGSTQVWFGGIPATAVVVTNATTMTCNAPAHAVGVVDVTVCGPGGNGTKAGSYTYT